MPPCLKGWPAKYECDNQCVETSKECRETCKVYQGEEKRQCKRECRDTRNACKSSCVRCDICEDENEPGDPEFCHKELPDFIAKLAKCKVGGGEIRNKCMSSCGHCPRRQLVEELTLTANGSGSDHSQPTAVQVQGMITATPAAEHVDSTVTLIGGAAAAVALLAFLFFASRWHTLIHSLL